MSYSLIPPPSHKSVFSHCKLKCLQGAWNSYKSMRSMRCKTLGQRYIIESDTCLVTMISKILHIHNSQIECKCNYVRSMDYFCRPWLTASHSWHDHKSQVKITAMWSMLFPVLYFSSIRNHSLWINIWSRCYIRKHSTLSNLLYCPTIISNAILVLFHKWKLLEIRTQAIIWHTGLH